MSVCVSACLSVREHVSLELLDRYSRNFVCGSPVTVTRFSSDGLALRYVLPVLRMTSRLAVMGHMPKHWSCTNVKRLPRAALQYPGGVWCLWMLVLYLFPVNILRIQSGSGMPARAGNFSHMPYMHYLYLTLNCLIWVLTMSY